MATDKVFKKGDISNILSSIYIPSILYRGGGSNSPISIVLHLKLTSTMILKELYRIEKCAICLVTFFKILELSICRIIKINKKVHLSVKNIPNKLHLIDAKSCMFF